MALTDLSYGRLVRRAVVWASQPVRLALLAAPLLLLALVGITRLTLAPSPVSYLRGSPEWAVYADIDRRYEIGEPVIITLREPGGTIFDVETVSAVAELDRILSAVPDVERVLSVASAVALSRRGDTLDVRPLLPQEPITKETTLALSARVREHPIYSQTLVDSRHESTFLLVQLSAQVASTAERVEAVRRIRAEADRFKSAHRTVHLAGTPMIEEALASALEHDVLLLFPAILILFAVLSWVIFGELATCLVPLASAILAAAAATGSLGLFGVPMTPLTALLPVLVAVAGLGEAIHFVAEARRQAARVPHPRAALLAAVEAVAVPSLLASAAASLGLLALAISAAGPLAAFGAAGALGMALAHGGAVLITPALLHLLGHPGRSRAASTAPRLSARMAELALFGHRHLLPTLALTGLLLGGTWAILGHLRVDSSFLGYLEPEHRLRRDIEVIERNLGGTEVIEVILESDAPGKFQSPEGLALLDRAGKALGTLPGVYRAFSLADYMRLANAVILGIPVTPDGPLPASAEAVAQLGLLDPGALAALASEDRAEARIAMQVPSMPSAEVLRLTAAAEATLGPVLDGAEVRATVTGRPPLYARLASALGSALAQSLAWALPILFVTLLVGLGSPGLAVATLLPSVLAVGLTFGVMALFGVPFDVNGPFVACLGIGAGVPAATHIAARHRRARDAGAPTAAAGVAYAASHAAHPVILTSVLLAVGLGILSLSPFAPTHRVGLLSVVLVGFGLLLELALMPALLVTADRLERRWEDQEDPDDEPRPGRARYRAVASVLTSELPEKRE